MCICVCREWREAMRVAYQHNRPDLVTTVVAPAAADHGAVHYSKSALGSMSLVS